MAGPLCGGGRGGEGGKVVIGGEIGGDTYGGGVGGGGVGGAIGATVPQGQASLHWSQLLSPVVGGTFALGLYGL